MAGNSKGTPHSIKPSDFTIGDKVVITKLQLKLQSQKSPAYVVGALCHIHPTTLSHYARGINAITPKHLQALCELFQCEPDDILGTIEVEVA